MNTDKLLLCRMFGKCFSNVLFLILSGMFCFAGVVAVEGSTAGKLLARVTVDAGKVERVDTPVAVELPQGLGGVEFGLFEVRDGVRVPVPSQVAKSAGRETLCWILSGKTLPAGKRFYELEQGKTEQDPGVELKDHDSALEVLCGGKPVLRYKYGIEPAPAGKDVKYAKSGFIHPVWSPGGQVLTQIHPADHIHHMGLWNAWTTTEFEGRRVDFWNIREGKGTVRFAKCLEKRSGPVFAGFKVMQEHVDLLAPGGAKVALNEDLEVRVWNVGQGIRLFDWVSIQRCASSSPLRLLQYRYGGLGFRAVTEWTKDNSDYLTSEGKTRANGHSTSARWGAMTGRTSKGEAGLLMMAHPQNREFPEPIRIWPGAEQNGMIFFNFCPVQKKEMTLEPGKDYEFRYRICTYDGLMTGESAERLWADFGNPPDVKLDKM